MNKLKELLDRLLIKLKFKQPPKQYKMIDKEEDFDVGKAVLTFLLNDGSSSSITFEGYACRYLDSFDSCSGSTLTNSFIKNLNVLSETSLINISPTIANKHYVKRSEIRRLTVVLSSHKVKVQWQEKVEV